MRYAIPVLLGVLVVGAIMVYAADEAQPSPGKAAAEAEAGVALPPPPPAVAVVPYKYETDYEMDPFERDKIRRTKTTVTHILLVNSDGTTVIKPAG